MTKLAQFRDAELETSGRMVGFYEREFYPFSNFSSFQVEWRGRLWPTAEHAYQVAHFFDTAPQLVEWIMAARSAHDAFKLARANAHLAPSDWDDQKAAIMREICRAKLLQHPYVQRKLMQTEDLPLVEDSPTDAYWGWGPDRNGRNELGKIWMELRTWWHGQIGMS